jgi:hypothetical protein
MGMDIIVSTFFIIDAVSSPSPILHSDGSFLKNFKAALR